MVWKRLPLVPRRPVLTPLHATSKHRCRPRQGSSDSSDGDSDASRRCQRHPLFPRLHPLVPLTYVLTMRACLADDPDARPTFDEVATLLENVAIEVAGGIYVDSTGHRQVCSAAASFPLDGWRLVTAVCSKREHGQTDVLRVQASALLQSIPKDPFSLAGFAVARPGDLSSDVPMRILGSRMLHEPRTSAPHAVRQHHGGYAGHLPAQAARGSGAAAAQQPRRPSALFGAVPDRGSGARPASEEPADGGWRGGPVWSGGGVYGERHEAAYRVDRGAGRQW